MQIYEFSKALSDSLKDNYNYNLDTISIQIIILKLLYVPKYSIFNSFIHSYIQSKMIIFLAISNNFLQIKKLITMIERDNYSKFHLIDYIFISILAQIKNEQVPFTEINEVFL